ncbi:hypothetical protein BDV93DRAFT_370148 [Ceratobasidium sp. AG-I]|nr:hypothetical protein BDV93DRAFT_370148 [Ceratobasidium sp. AG-I]
MNYPSPAEPIQSPVVAGQQAFGRNDHPGQGVTHFGINPPTESNIKVEPATQGSDFSVGHDSFSQASHGNVPAAYGHPNQGYGHGYDASLQHQQQAFHGHGTYSGVSQNSQQHFYHQNHHGHVYNNNYQPYQHSPQQQHSAPPSNDYAPPQPTYGVYDPHRHDEDQQLAHEAPYEEYEQYEEPLMKDVERGELMLNTPPEFVRPSALEGRSAATPEQFSNHGSPGVATSTRESGYGQASHDDTFQVRFFPSAIKCVIDRAIY